MTAPAVSEFPDELRVTYEPVRILGEGAMGVVFEATHRGLGRRLAVKVMAPGTGTDDDRARFAREVRALAMLSHPGVVKLFDGDVVGQVPYYSMELLSGETLDARSRRGRMDEAEVRALLIELLEPLAYVHQQGLLHRDLKPSNVFRTDDGRTLLIDFGLSRSSAPATLVTEAGSLLGTPFYCAPELLREGRHSVSSDLFAVGLIGIEMWTGGNVHRDASDLPALLSSIGSGAYHSTAAELLRGRGRLASVLLRAIMPNPGDRFESAAAMLDAVRESASHAAAAPVPAPPGETQKMRPRPRWLPAACAVGALLGLVVAARWQVRLPRAAAREPASASTAPQLASGADPAQAWEELRAALVRELDNLRALVAASEVLTTTPLFDTVHSVRDAPAIAPRLQAAVHHVQDAVAQSDQLPFELGRELVIEGWTDSLTSMLYRHSRPQRTGAVLRAFQSLELALRQRRRDVPVRAIQSDLFTARLDELLNDSLAAHEAVASAMDRMLVELDGADSTFRKTPKVFTYELTLAARAASAWQHARRFSVGESSEERRSWARVVRRLPALLAECEAHPPADFVLPLSVAVTAVPHVVAWTPTVQLEALLSIARRLEAVAEMPAVAPLLRAELGDAPLAELRRVLGAH